MRAPRVEGVEILGPAQAPMAVLRNQHRWRFLVRAPKNYPIQKYIQSWLGTLELPRHLKMHIDIDPIFGNLNDFDKMITTAHELGLKIMIDLVLSHTADVHEWFIESRSSKDNPRHDWYVWADAKPDGTAPNNWLSIFGGPAWTWDTTRCQYYMHNFLTSQPDLNFHNADVQNALLDVARFWLDRGVDGFRLDTINFYFCDQQLRDNPALPDSERNNTIAPEVNPYNHLITSMIKTNQKTWLS